MEKKTKFGIVTISLITLCLGITLMSFQMGLYVRDASLQMDVGTGYCIHFTIAVNRANGDYELIKDGVALDNAGVLTNVGLDFIEGKLFNDGFANASANAKYLCLSTSASSPSAAWIDLPSEITTNGLERAEAAYASTGVGTCTLTYQWTATDTHTDVQLVGWAWDDTAGDGSLFGSDTFTPVTLNDGDKLTVTATNTVT